jgi:ubiquinone biosynthesis protein
MKRFVRAFGVVRVALRYLVLPLLFRTGQETGAVRFRKALESLGGAWVKLGQTLALRFDILPPDYCTELFKLLNRLEPFRYSEVQRIVRAELGADPEHIFQSFERECLAAASIGQVHRAVLKTGERVAVKVQRPNIERLIEADIQLMYMSSWLIDTLHLLGRTRSRDLIDEFARWTRDELDYQIEARHGDYLRRNAGQAKFEHNAGIYWQYSSRRVLTSELLEWPPFNQILSALHSRDETRLHQFAAEGIDFKILARHMCWNLLNQVYVRGYFHADLHPANLIALPANAVGYVDFGIVGTLTPVVRESLVHYAFNLFNGRIDRALDEFMRWVIATPSTDVAAARRELTEVFTNYLLDLEHASSSIATGEDVSSFDVQLLDVIRRHGLSISAELTMYFKAMITSSTVIFQLDPDFDLIRIETAFFREVIASRMQSLANPAVVASWAFDLSYRAGRFLDTLEQLATTGNDLEKVAGEVRSRIHLYTFLAAVSGAAFLLLKFFPIQMFSAPITQTLPWIIYAPVALVVIFVIGIIRQNRRLPQSRSAVRSGDIVDRSRIR